MEKIVILGIGLLLALLVMVYFLLTRKLNRLASSRYWNPKINSRKEIETLQKEFRQNEQYSNAYKTLIRICIQSRNASGKLLGEATDLVKQKTDGHPIRDIDLQIAAEISKTIKLLLAELNSELNKPEIENRGIKNVHERELKSSLENILKSAEELIHSNKMVYSPEHTLEKISEEIKVIYQEIIIIHEKLIADYQTILSN